VIGEHGVQTRSDEFEQRLVSVVPFGHAGLQSLQALDPIVENLPEGHKSHAEVPPIGAG